MIRRSMPTLTAAQEAKKLARQIGDLIVAVDDHPVTKSVDAATDVAGTAGKVDGWARWGRMLNESEARMLGRARQSLRLVVQTSFDLARAERELERAVDTARHFRSEAAASAEVFMRAHMKELEAVVLMESGRVRNLRAQIAETSGTVGKRLSKLVGGSVAYLEGSRFGRAVADGGRAVGPLLDKLGKVTDGIAVAAATIKSFREDPDRSRGARVLGAAVTGALATGAEFVVKRNPLVSLADTVGGKIEEKLTGRDEARNTISAFYANTSRIYAGVAEAAMTGDSAPLDRVHARNMSGQSGLVLQGYAMIGESLSKSGWLDRVAEAYGNWAYGAPDDFQRSAAWREGAKAPGGPASP